VVLVVVDNVVPPVVCVVLLVVVVCDRDLVHETYAIPPSRLRLFYVPSL
jgi:hypothetical protein